LHPPVKAAPPGKPVDGRAKAHSLHGAFYVKDFSNQLIFSFFGAFNLAHCAQLQKMSAGVIYIWVSCSLKAAFVE